MKRTSTILKGLFALAVAFTFTQCANNSAQQPVQASQAAGSADVKIAFVEIDSLLTKYNFCKDLNEMIIKKEENIRTTLNEKAKKLEKDMAEFQRKYENN